MSIDPVSSSEKPVLDPRWLWGAGYALLLLCGLFVWRDLAVGPEYLLIAATAVAAAMVTGARPRWAPQLGVFLLFGASLTSAMWFANGAIFGTIPDDAFQPRPLVLTALLALVGCARPLWEQRRKYSLQTILPVSFVALAASLLTYYQLFTVGVAAEHAGRRLVLTLFWLAAGLAVSWWAQRKRDGALAVGGLIAIGCACVKAALYDTTHLSGTLRIAVLGIAGLALLGGAALLGKGQRQ